MSIVLLFTGDFCPIGRAQLALEDNKIDEYINDVKTLFSDTDYNVVNLETPLTTSSSKIKKSGPNIKVSKESISFLNKLNVHLACLANNHIMDYGKDGLRDTIQVCKENMIDTVGAGKNEKEARKGFIKEIKGKKIAFYNVAENEFCSAKGVNAGANTVNIIHNLYDIQRLKKEVDYLIVVAHGGREHYQLPTPLVQERYRFYIDSGADTVIGHHPHCYSGVEEYNKGHIFYSLGNFLFDYKKKYQKGKWTEAMIVELILDENLSTSYKVHPFFQGRATDPKLKLMKGKDKDTFEQKFQDLNRIIVDKNAMEKKWADYIKTQAVSYKSSLMIDNRYLRYGLDRLGLSKLLHNSKKHQLLLLNLLRCETHHEIMTNVLEENL